MTVAQAIISGIVQGLTEFLPISSSGHLVILHRYFELRDSQILFDIFLHLGTLVATIVVLWRDILTLFSTERRVGFLIMAGSVPTVIVAILFGDLFEKFFVNVRVVGIMLVVTGIWLALGSVKIRFSSLGKSSNSNRRLYLWQALIIGTAQGVALIPGISRSGATISTGLLCGVEKRLAVIFSFLLAIPATLGAVLFKIRDIGGANYIFVSGKLSSRIEIIPLLIGSITAAVTGMFAIRFLMDIVKRGRLYIFSFYCVIAGIGVLGLL